MRMVFSIYHPKIELDRRNSMENGCEILVVDDEESITDVLKKELSSDGYQVQTAHDGQEAIDAVKSTPIALVVLDLQMPKVNGFDVLRYVKENFPGVKVIVLTGYADLGNAIRCKRLGADQFLEKPFNLSEFLTEMHRLIPLNGKHPIN